MSAPDNIVKFNEVTGVILASLYESFPVKKSFEVTSLFPETAVEPSDKPIINHEAIFVTSATEWLFQTGYISVNKIIFGHSVRDAVLTAKGLELLKLTPDAIGPSFGDKLLEATKSGMKDTIVNVSSAVLTSGISLLYKTLGS
ncbi:hypothetical protein MU9_2028 [Morganella morganii subsp. morganii KT]|uniref:DUF2513 domain-containing protein n=1 Tax=Morganella morganii subsp. morganii KT TaxID=1124991 RepID=J7U5I3_MORMO|nr:hypothetical protein [Morganella morganii]AGG31074.1 hypothetical protein MU9_2028 [Morganella morganii subsp. morganii KT]